jgi:hypothetical protein
VASPAGLTAATRSALFVLGAAADAGFQFRVVGVGKLEVLGPPGLPDDLCEPVNNAVRVHAPEIVRLLRWFDAERRHGRFWRPRPEPRARQ